MMHSMLMYKAVRIPIFSIPTFINQLIMTVIIIPFSGFIINFNEIKKMGRQLLIIHSDKNELSKIKKILSSSLSDINLHSTTSESKGITQAKKNVFCLILIEGKLIKDLTITKLKSANTQSFLSPSPFILLINIEDKKKIRTLSKSDAYLSNQASPDDLINMVSILLRVKLAEHNNCNIDNVYFQKEESSFEFNWILDKNFKHIFISPSIKEIRGVTAEEALKEDIKDTMPSESYEKILKINKEISKAAKAKNRNYKTRTEYQHYCKDGSLIWVEALCWPIFDDNDNFIGLKGVTRDINDRKKVELSLIENQKQYKDLVENSLEGIYVIREKKIVFCNLHFAEIFGYKSPEEIIGVQIQSLIHPDDFIKVQEKISMREKGEAQSAHYEFRGIKKDGTLIWLETLGGISTFNHKSAIQGVLRDISEKKESEELIRKLSRSVEQSPVSIVITDINGDIEYANPKFEEVSGYKLNEVIGKSMNIIKSGITPDQDYKKLWRTITSGNAWRGEFLNKKKNGDYFWELASISPIKNKKGEITHFIGFKEDITERKRMEKEVIIAKEKAEESDKLKTSFLANMSHEIRTPMNAIMGFSGLLSDETLTRDEREEFIDLINNNCKNLLTLIDDIIDIAKIEAGQLKIIKKDFKINDVMNEICMTYQKVKSKESKEHLDLQFDEEHSSNIDIVHTDEYRLKQVLSNLVGNAIKYTLNGSVKFGYKLIKDIKSDSDAQLIQIYVKDTGIGIPTEKIKIIFERFRQADDSHTRIFGGTGLGLAISQNIARLLGGDIKVVSKVNTGSVFYFTIPYIPGKNLTEESFKTIDKKQQIDWSDKTVLIAEDVDSNYFLINTILKRTRIKDVWVKNGEQAIKEFDSRNDIDIILMDMQMPVLNGYEATRTIKSLDETIPIIAVTAFALEGDKEKILKAGCNDYLSKPLKSELLISKMYNYLKK